MASSNSQTPTKVYKKSDIIFEENSRGDEMYVIRSGRVKLLLGDISKDISVGTLDQPGDFFGEMALIDNSPRTATAIAEEDNTELEVIDQKSFVNIIRELPEFALSIMHELCERTRIGNVLYLEVVKEAMSPFCRQNCLGKTMNAFAREAMSKTAQKPSSQVTKMPKWKCPSCAYVYVPGYGHPNKGIEPGTPFDQLPDDWKCPDCGVSKSTFIKI